MPVYAKREDSTTTAAQPDSRAPKVVTYWITVTLSPRTRRRIERMVLGVRKQLAVELNMPGAFKVATQKRTWRGRKP